MSKRLNYSRINYDLQDLQSGDIPDTIAEVEINNENILGPHYIKLCGPSDTPYEGGHFKMELNITETYPFQPPLLKFHTKMYHPNIARCDGSICIDILKDQWSASLKLKSLILSISSLLANPNPRDPLESQIADIYVNSREKFNKQVREYVKKYSMKENDMLMDKNLDKDLDKDVEDMEEENYED
jgi:ubiquitin-conjugating enzyme (huntingtin interacting protein 2)